MGTRAVASFSLGDFKLDSIRGRAGFFRVGQTRAGQWWFIDAFDRPFFYKAVGGVNRLGRPDGRATRGGLYAAQVAATHLGGRDAFVSSTISRLRNWQVNALGPGAAPEFFEQDIAYVETVDFRKAGPVIHAGPVWLPDVFDPAWHTAAQALAGEICGPRRESRELIGYFIDDEPGWAQPRADRSAGIARAESSAATERPSLLQVCLSLEPSFPAYHAAWEFVLAPRNRNLDTLARDWSIALPNKETLRQLTRAETPLLSEGYRHDQRRFAREFARRYFSTCAAAIRTHDPHHLILGCRFGEYPGGTVLTECVYPHVDVVSFHSADPGLDRLVHAYHAATAMPLLIDAFSWAGEAFRERSAKRESRRFTTVERMLARGRVTLEHLIAQRNVVGYVWARWADDDDATPPFGRGLVRVNGSDAIEHTELLADLNARAEKLRLKAK